jgi:FtsP/CotA-like multicopper oxidase with cupredoxin domain
MITRRQILSSTTLAAAAAIATKIPRALADSSTSNSQPPSTSNSSYTAVHTLNGSTLPSKTIDGIKIMHLTAEQIEHEFAPGLKAHCWGYNGHTPGPTIEAVAGDRLRIYVTNHLPAPTTIHWHGIRIINGMDGVNGLTQPPIQPGQTFRYEFTVPDPGTFMYHPHFDEMTQQAMGMMGMFIVHPRTRPADAPDREYVIMLSEWRIDPGASRPVTTEMTEFNILTMNSKCYPATEPIVAQLGERIRLRFGNLGAMDHHPIHLHGFQMNLVETDGGIVPESARYPANTVLVPVGSTRAMDFIADNPGDWPMHCHMTHHTMNQMGHNVPNLVGANERAINKAVQPVLNGYMTMGTEGMGDMADMQMPAPKNSIPMLGAKGQFGTIDMGGMFTIVKVRDKINGYEDPGNYNFPPGTVASEATPQELQRDGIDPVVPSPGTPGEG